MRQRATTRRAFTLVELLLVIMIIAMLGGMTVVVSRSALEMAKRSKTEMTVARIDGVITAMYEKYQYRKIDLTPYLNDIGFDATGNEWWYNQGANLTIANLPDVWTQGGTINVTNSPTNNREYYPGLIRLHVLRDTIRMEMPCWAAELAEPIQPDGSSDTTRNISALTELYWDALISVTGQTTLGDAFTYVKDNWSILDHAAFNAELLYLVVMNGDPDARSIFTEREIGDTNGNGLPEFIDGWGNPIHWFRQAVALPTTDRQDAVVSANDPMDPLNLDAGVTVTTIPFVFSSGPDGLSGLDSGKLGFNANRFLDALVYDYPFQSNTLCGQVTNVDESADNIHSHKVVR